MKRFVFIFGAIVAFALFLTSCSAQSEPKTAFDEAKDNILYAQETFDIPDKYVDVAAGMLEVLLQDIPGEFRFKVTIEDQAMFGAITSITVTAESKDSSIQRSASCLIANQS